MVRQLAALLVFVAGALVAALIAAAVVADVARLFADAGTGWALLALLPAVLLAGWAFLLAPPPG